MRIFDRTTGEILGKVITNHSMTLEQACELCDVECDPDTMALTMEDEGAVWHVEASFERDGQTIDCSTAEVLGDAFSQYYASRQVAIDAAEDAQMDIEDCAGLAASTCTSVYRGRLQVWRAVE